MIKQPPREESSFRAILDHLIRTVSSLSETDRDRLMPDIDRLQRCCIETNTTLKDSQTQLQESQERFNLLADTNPLLIWMTDDQGSNYYINQTYQDFIGIKFKDMQEFDWKTFLHPEDAPRYITAFQQAMQEQREFHAETRARRADGVWRWISCAAYPRFSNEGKFLGLIGTSRDVTDQKQADALLHETLDRMTWLASLPDQNPYPVLRISNDGIVLYHNLAAGQVFGDTLQDGKLVPEPIRYAAEQARTCGEKVQQDIELGDREFTLTCMPFLDENYINIYGSDITESKRMDQELRQHTEALRESEEKFHGSFIHAAIGFATTTPDGRFLDANPAYCALTGYSIEELRNFAFDQLVHPDDHDQNMIMNERMTSGQINDFLIENRYVRKDGQVVWVRKSVSQVRDRAGTPKWNIALIEDITERKQAELALRENEAALRASTAALNERNLALEQAHNDLINERNRLLAIMDALPTGLAILDHNGAIIQENPEYRAVWGEPLPTAHSIDEYDLYSAWWAEGGQRIQPDDWAGAKAVRYGVTNKNQFIRIRKFDGTEGYVLNGAAPVRNAKGKIIGGVVAIMEITQRVEAEKALQEIETNMEVQRRLMDQREQERQAIARDIHDGPIQTLSSTTFHLQMLKEVYPDPSLQVELNQVGIKIKNSIQELRQVINELRPPSLMHFGLSRVIRIYTEDIREQHREIEFVVDVVDDAKILSDQACLSLFRIYQASLNNTLKHSGANKVWVIYKIDPETFTLEIRDNGKGFDTSRDLNEMTRQGHFGLVGMKERAESLGGTLTLRSEPGQGTAITVTGPLSGKNIK